VPPGGVSPRVCADAETAVTTMPSKKATVFNVYSVPHQRASGGVDSGRASGVVLSGRDSGVGDSGRGSGTSFSGRGSGTSFSGRGSGTTFSGRGSGTTLLSGRGGGTTFSGRGAGVVFAGRDAGVAAGVRGAPAVPLGVLTAPVPGCVRAVGLVDGARPCANTDAMVILNAKTKAARVVTSFMDTSLGKTVMHAGAYQRACHKSVMHFQRVRRSQRVSVQEFTASSPGTVPRITFSARIVRPVNPLLGCRAEFTWAQYCPEKESLRPHLQAISQGVNWHVPCYKGGV
jgi:hypothetical protein